MHDPGIDAQRAQAFERSVKALFLFARLLANGGVGENFRRSKVREDSGELQMLAFRQLPRKAFHIGGSDAQPVHSRIDFQMERHALLAAAARRRPIQQRQLLAAMDHRRKVVLYQPRFFSRHETRKHENRLSNAGFANGNALVSAGDAEPVRVGLLQRLCYLRAAVAVAIALHDAENLARRFALFLRWIDVLANRIQIVRQRAKRNFRPHGTSHFLARTLLRACHRFPKKIVYDIRAARADGHFGCRVIDNSLSNCI